MPSEERETAKQVVLGVRRANNASRDKARHPISEF